MYERNKEDIYARLVSGQVDVLYLQKLGECIAQSAKANRNYVFFLKSVSTFHSIPSSNIIFKIIKLVFLQVIFAVSVAFKTSLDAIFYCF